MKIATVRQKPEKQPALFDRGISSLGQARTLIGEHFEDFASEFFQADRLKCSAVFDVCPDLKFAEKEFGECKSSGRNNQVIIYEERLKRYDEFQKLGNRLVYVILNHDVKVDELVWMSDLELLTQRLHRIIFVEAAVIHSACKAKKPRAVNKWHTQAAYHFGWTIQISEIIKRECKIFEGSALKRNQLDLLFPF